MFERSLRRIGLVCRIVFFAIVPSASSTAEANETQSYSYDALGRLVSTQVSGGPNSGVAVSTQLDPAGNRTRYAVSASGGAAAPSPTPPSPPPPSPPIIEPCSGICSGGGPIIVPFP